MRRTRAGAKTAIGLVGLLLLTSCAQMPAQQPPATPASADSAQASAMPASTNSPQPVTTVRPTATPEPEATPGRCDAGSLLAIWAHYDDDLLFGHQRVTQALDAGWCVTVAYLSAGDAGRGVEYSHGRELGIRDAYSTLRSFDGQWAEYTDVLETGVTVEEWTHADEPQLTLLSFRLVDGNVDGSGFEGDGFRSLAKLADGTIDTIGDVDGPENLTKDQVTHSLAEIITDARPDAVITGMPREEVELAKSDHSDHSATASFARAAWKSMGIAPTAVTLAIGYQTSGYPANVDGDVLSRKATAFSAYAIKDPVTANCVDLPSCLANRPFGVWLQREYARSAADFE